MQTLITRFAGHDLILDASGAAYLPASQTLLLADLHFEKASFFARHGQFLPPYDTAETCAAIADAIARHRPARVVCLGDSFHDIGAESRMRATDLACLTGLVNDVQEWFWVTGNHDPLAPQAVGGHVAPSLLLDGLLLTHEPLAESIHPQICGHFHPKFRGVVAGLRLNAPCFAWNDAVFIMPAFGSLTGGLELGHAALRQWLGPAPEAVMCHRKALYPMRRMEL